MNPYPLIYGRQPLRKNQICDDCHEMSGLVAKANERWLCATCTQAHHRFLTDMRRVVAQIIRQGVA